MILVTGASGHIGKHLIAALIKRKERVRVFVRNRGLRLSGVEMAYGDVLDASAVRRAAEGADVIYHLAAAISAPEKLQYEVNVVGTRNILENSSAKKFIYLSSTAVYGYDMKENPARETTPFNPKGSYGRSKIMAEKLVLERNGIVLRAPVVFGPGFNAGFEFVLKQLEKGKMPIIGRGNNQIHWIHISDLIQALLLAKDRGKPGEIYLVAGKEIKTQRELFSLLAKYLGVPPPAKEVSKIAVSALAYYKTLSSRMDGKKPKLTLDDVSRMTSDRAYDISKARRELGFEPRVTYAQAAKEMVEEYLKSKNTG